MIRKESMYLGNAYRLSDDTLDASVVAVEAGQFLTKNEAGFWVIADGTKRSFICLNHKTAERDNITPTGGKVTCLGGIYRLETDQYEAGVYAVGDELVVGAEGKLQKRAAEDAALVVATVDKAPAEAGDLMAIISK